MKRQAYSPFALTDRAARFPGESWQGYLLRLAENNALNGVQDLANILNVSLIELLQTDQEKFRRALQAPSAWEVNSFPISRARTSMFTRVCGTCLSSDAEPFIREKWERPLGISCEVHGCLLADRCETCKRRLSWRRERLQFCSCGASIGPTRKPVPSWWPNVLYAFECDVFKNGSSDEDDLKRVARFLNWLAEQERERRDLFLGSETVLGPSDSLFSIEGLPHIKHWFDDWPRSFERNARRLPAKLHFNRLYRWRVIYRFKKPREILELVDGTPSVASVAGFEQIANVGIQTLRLWQEFGYLPSLPLVNHSKLSRIHKESPEIAEALVAIWNTTIALNDVGWFFGAPYWSISLFAEASAQQVLPSRYSDEYARVNTDGIVREAMKVLSRAIPRQWDASSFQKVRFHQLLYRVIEGGGLSEYLKFLDSRRLNIYMEPGTPRLDGIYVEWDDLWAWADHLASPRAVLRDVTGDA